MVAALSFIRSIAFDFRLYFCNSVVSVIPIWRLRKFSYRALMGFEVGEGCQIMRHAHFDSLRHLTIGARTITNRKSQIDSRGGITIGSDVVGGVPGKKIGMRQSSLSHQTIYFRFFA